MTPIQVGDELRAAAKLMRERAEGAEPGPWEWAEEGTPVVPWVKSPRGAVVAGYRFNIEHIASWHPGVALAVADWLEQRAAEYDEYTAGPYGAAGAAFVAGDAGGEVDPAVAVARAYLGTSGDALAEVARTFTEQEGP